MADIPHGDFVELNENGEKHYIAHLGAVYSCTCEEWKGQTAAHDRRTCRHLRDYRGALEEERRINPSGSANRTYRQSSDKSTVSPASISSDKNRDGDVECEASSWDEFVEEYGDGEEELATWTVVVPYESNIKAALEKARQHEFETHFSGWPSIAEATMEATGTILDIKYVLSEGPPGMATTCPLPASIVRSVFGTQKPTRKMVTAKVLRAITRTLFSEWNRDDSWEFCLQSFYILLYEERSIKSTPSAILFGGWADNC